MSTFFFFFFFNDTATTEIYTLSLHDALPISSDPVSRGQRVGLLTHLDGPPPAWAVQEETRPNDRIVDATRADVLFRAPPPAERVPLHEIEERSAERASGDANGCHVEEAASEARAPSGCQRVADAFVLRCDDEPFARRTDCNPGGENEVRDILHRCRERVRDR